MMKDSRGGGGAAAGWIGQDAKEMVRVPDQLEAVTRDRDRVSYNRTQEPLILDYPLI